MGFLRVVRNVQRRAVRVDGRFHHDKISAVKVLRGAVQVELLESVESREDPQRSMAAMVSLADGHTPWVEQRHRGVERREPRGVRNGTALEQRGENRLEPIGIWRRKAGVDDRPVIRMCLPVSVSTRPLE